MANIINRTTLQYIENVNASCCNGFEWIINPELPECEAKYWKIIGDEVLEMTAEEKTAKDELLQEQADEVTKENYIAAKIIVLNREDAIAALIVDGILDENGDLI